MGSRDEPRGEPAKDGDAEEFKVFVGGISWHMTDRELKDTFKKYNATDARVMLDKHTGRSRGFGFCMFGKQKDMEEAISKMHGIEVDGRKISVTRAIPQSETAPGTPAAALLGRGGASRDSRDRGYGGGGYRGYGDRAGYDRGGYGGRGGYPDRYASRGYERPPGYDRGGSHERMYSDRGYDRGYPPEYDRGYERGYGGPSYGGYERGAEAYYGRDPYAREYPPHDRGYPADYPYSGAYDRAYPADYDRPIEYPDRYQGGGGSERSGNPYAPADRGAPYPDRGAYRGPPAADRPADRAVSYDRYGGRSAGGPERAGGPDREYGRYQPSARPGPYDRSGPPVAGSRDTAAATSR